jgi:hypothetical protein
MTRTVRYQGAIVQETCSLSWFFVTNSAKFKNEARESSNTVLGCRVQSGVITLNL